MVDQSLTSLWGKINSSGERRRKGNTEHEALKQKAEDRRRRGQNTEEGRAAFSGHVIDQSVAF